MKTLFLLFTILAPSALLWAQAPEKMSYQAVIRDAENDLVKNQNIGMQISILQGSTNGLVVYKETQTPATNANGLISIEIGIGNTADDFSSIDWASGPYFIKTETDPNGGNNYSITGTSQLLSVPYALYANITDSASNVFSGNFQELSNTPIIKDSISAYLDTTTQFVRTEIDGSVTNELQTLLLTEDTLTISGTNYVILKQEPPVIWSGGCSSHGQATGFNIYCTDRTDFNTTDGYLSVNTNGRFTVLKAGYYRVNMWAISYGPNWAHMRLIVNGTYKHYGHEHANDLWTDNFMDVIWKFDVGDQFYVDIYNPGNYAYHRYNANGAHSRLQVIFEGPLE